MTLTLSNIIETKDNWSSTQFSVPTHSNRTFIKKTKYQLLFPGTIDLGWYWRVANWKCAILNAPYDSWRARLDCWSVLPTNNNNLNLKWIYWTIENRTKSKMMQQSCWNGNADFYMPKPTFTYAYFDYCMGLDFLFLKVKNRRNLTCIT